MGNHPEPNVSRFTDQPAYIGFNWDFGSTKPCSGNDDRLYRSYETLVQTSSWEGRLHYYHPNEPLAIWSRTDTLLDISGIGINNKLVGQNLNSTTIRGIVGRFYNVGSGTNTYTSGGGETSINYIHYGEPVIINSFTVKILDSEGNDSPQDLGADNTIFLNVVNKIEFEEEENNKKK